MVCEDLTWFRVFVDGFIEEPDGVLGGAFLEYLAACDVAAVVVKGCDQPPGVYEFEVALRLRALISSTVWVGVRWIVCGLLECGFNPSRPCWR
jgi:hypothetical protein